MSNMWVYLKRRKYLLHVIVVIALITPIVYSYFSKPPPPIMSLNDIRIDLKTDKAEYLLNETIEATFYLCNDRLNPVRIRSPTQWYSTGYSPDDPNKIMAEIYDTPDSKYIEIPADSRKEFYSETFKSKYPGDFYIRILGASTTVTILDMSFSVSREEAIEIALGQVTQRYHEVEADIRFMERSENITINHHVWRVNVYLAKKSAPSGKLIRVLIDLNSGEVIAIDGIGWAST